MNENEIKYFQRMCDYKPTRRTIINSDSIQKIDYTSSRIRNFARETLSGEISPFIAKKEIKNLKRLIKELNSPKIIN